MCRVFGGFCCFHFFPPWLCKNSVPSSACVNVNGDFRQLWTLLPSTSTSPNQGCQAGIPTTGEPLFWGKDLCMCLLLCVFWKIRKGLSSLLTESLHNVLLLLISFLANAGGTLLWTETWGWITQGAVHRVLSCLSVLSPCICMNKVVGRAQLINQGSVQA